MTSWYEIRGSATGAQVAIYDEIGAHGVSAKGFLADLGALAHKTAIDLRLNSPGGSVFDAVAIHNALRRHEGKVTVWIDGIAASAASYVAMAGDEIIMPQNAFLMIHDPSGLVIGTADDMRSMADALDKVKGSLVHGYAGKSGRTVDEISALMAAETWFDANDALDLGLADRIADPVRIAARFDIGRFRNVPPELAKVAETAGDSCAEHGASGQPKADKTGITIDATETATGQAGAADGAIDSDATASAIGDAEATADEDEIATNPEDETDVAAGDDDDAIVLPGPERSIAETDTQQAAADIPPASGAPPDAAAIRLDAMVHAKAVIDLCRLAGQPQMASSFLEADTDLDEVRAALLAIRAEAEPEITGHHSQPGRAMSASPWGEIVARTFKLERKNP